ncbi:kinase-like domain-containing protein [Epithele typhae]|uniref:kinase-like domain-containing protein n=1 Tax=Epithele typhae TaxID=378194 RepID=UPI002007263F|nr:kinase-like domain-containing protein [Epithele typhae]KAH9916278.1 kinase-like domain-containing protein [Epithele typhae]
MGGGLNPPLPATGFGRLRVFVGVCVYSLLGFIADIFYDMLRALRIVATTRPAADYKPSSVDDWTDEQLIDLHVNGSEERASLPPLHVNPNPRFVNVWPFTHDTVCKRDGYFPHDGPSPEGTALDIVFRHTTIPVPRVRRTLYPTVEGGHRDSTLTIMDRIPGRPLEQVWPTLSLLGKLRVACVLRSYIRQLRAIRHPRAIIPGPLAPGLTPLSPYNLMFAGGLDRYVSPWQNIAEFTAWFVGQYERSKACFPEEHAGTTTEPLDVTGPLVLTHCDIAMRNVMVGDDGRVYLIDWEHAGFYPQWVEYVNWRNWICWMVWARKHSADTTDRLWKMLIPFMTMGPYPRQERWFQLARLGIDN